MTKATAAAVLAAAACALAGCTHRAEHTTTTTQQQHRVARNPSTFPLYGPNEIVDVKRLDAGPMVAAFRRHDPRDRSENYRGNEVVVATSASIGELSAWLRKLEHAPPQGLRYANGDTVVQSSDPEAMRSAGAVAASFQSPNSDRIVVVVAVDPRMLRTKLGSALDLVDQYNKVPGMLRGPIDASMKDQIGYSVTEMLDPASPVGVAFRGMKSAEARNKRAILLIDEKRASE